MCAALLTDQRVALSNVPSLVDVSTMGKLLRQMGVEVHRPADGQLTLRAAAISEPTAPYELVKTMRASVLVLGPLLARCGRARVSLPGGCAIGLRPVDQHVKGLQAMGATISVEHGYMHASADRLRGARIVMDLVTVTGTENLLMAAVLAEGETLLENAAREPEVVDLAECLALPAIASGIAGITETIFGNRFMHAVELQRLGAQISIQGNTAVVKGVARLQGAAVMATDLRASAGLVIAGLVAEGQTVVDRIYHLDRGYEALEKKLTALGARIERVR